MSVKFFRIHVRRETVGLSQFLTSSVYKASPAPLCNSEGFTSKGPKNYRRVNTFQNITKRK